MTDLERIIDITPAYDCLAVQPCVRGSVICKSDSSRNCGRHNAELLLTLRGDRGEITLQINTGWYLPETPEHVKHSAHRSMPPPEPMSMIIHSPCPQYEDQAVAHTDCDLYGTCYVGSTYTYAKVSGEILVRQGLNAVWEWMEEQYHNEDFLPGTPEEA